MQLAIKLLNKSPIFYKNINLLDWYSALSSIPSKFNNRIHVLFCQWTHNLYCVGLDRVSMYVKRLKRNRWRTVLWSLTFVWLPVFCLLLSVWPGLHGWLEACRGAAGLPIKHSPRGCWAEEWSQVGPNMYLSYKKWDNMFINSINKSMWLMILYFMEAC